MPIESAIKAKVMHMASKISDRGVSALCFATPRPILLSVATWTLRADAVTCRRCLAQLKAGREVL